MSAPSSLGFGLCKLVEESEDEEEVRDMVLSGVGKLSSSARSFTPAQREELVRVTSMLWKSLREEQTRKDSIQEQV